MFSTPSGVAIIAEMVVNLAVIESKCSLDPFPHWQVVFELSQSHCLYIKFILYYIYYNIVYITTLYSLLTYTLE